MSSRPPDEPYDDARPVDDEPHDAEGDLTTGGPSGPLDEPDPRLDPDAARTAAAAALLRARAVAKGKGLRPGSRAKRRRRPSEVMLSGSAAEVDGRDPLLLGDTLERLVAGRGWQSDVKVGSVMGRWPQVVGANVAEHSEPITFDDGVLTVRASSTAWATQLRLMASSILGRLAAEVGEGVVVELRVVGPSAPRWGRGPRRATDGRGPRDTYG